MNSSTVIHCRDNKWFRAQDLNQEHYCITGKGTSYVKFDTQLLLMQSVKFQFASV